MTYFHTNRRFSTIGLSFAVVYVDISHTFDRWRSYYQHHYAGMNVSRAPDSDLLGLVTEPSTDTPGSRRADVWSNSFHGTSCTLFLERCCSRVFREVQLSQILDVTHALVLDTSWTAGETSHPWELSLQHSSFSSHCCDHQTRSGSFLVYFHIQHWGICTIWGCMASSSASGLRQ